MKRIGVGALVLLAFIVIVGLLRSPQAAVAQAKSNGAKVAIGYPNYPNGGEVVGSYYATLSQSGKIVRSGSATDGINITWESVPEGDYELIIEAKGHNSLNMPVHIVIGDTNCYASRAPVGEGVLYFGKTPSMQQLLERINKLEDTVKELQSKK